MMLSGTFCFPHWIKGSTRVNIASFFWNIQRLFRDFSSSFFSGLQIFRRTRACLREFPLTYSPMNCCGTFQPGTKEKRSRFCAKYSIVKMSNSLVSAGLSFVLQNSWLQCAHPPLWMEIHRHLSLRKGEARLKEVVHAFFFLCTARCLKSQFRTVPDKFFKEIAFDECLYSVPLSTNQCDFSPSPRCYFFPLKEVYRGDYSRALAARACTRLRLHFLKTSLIFPAGLPPAHR